MAEITTGVVKKLKLSDTRGIAEVLTTEAFPRTVPFLIWFGSEAHGPSALYTSELTTALARGLTVDVVHEWASAYIEDLIIHAP